MNRNIYVPLRHSFFGATEDLKAGELRTLALLLCYDRNFIIYETYVAKEMGFSTSTAQRYFANLLRCGYIIKITNDRDQQQWLLTEKALKLKAIIGGEIKNKHFTRYTKDFITTKDLSDTEWMVLAVMLSNTTTYQNYATKLRETLNIPMEKRSTLSEITKRLVTKGFIVKDSKAIECYYVTTDKALDYIIKIDRTEYMSQEEQNQAVIDNAVKKAVIMTNKAPGVVTETVTPAPMTKSDDYDLIQLIKKQNQDRSKRRFLANMGVEYV